MTKQEQAPLPRAVRIAAVGCILSFIAFGCQENAAQKAGQLGVGKRPEIPDPTYLSSLLKAGMTRAEAHASLKISANAPTISVPVSLALFEEPCRSPLFPENTTVLDFEVNRTNGNFDWALTKWQLQPKENWPMLFGDVTHSKK